MMNLPIYYHDEAFSKYDFGDSHLFSPVRQRLTIDLLRRASLLEEAAIVAPPPLDDETLFLFHTPEYVQAVKQAGQTGANSGSVFTPFGIGSSDNPAFSNMHEAAAVRTAATVDAVQRVARGDLSRAANFGGGLHHAMADKASGFCIYNDAAVAIAWLRKHTGLRVAYVDIDAHHGDGVQWGFYDDPGVLTVSIHEHPQTLFPFTGFADEIGQGDAKGTSINIPLLAETNPESWLECFEHVVPPVLRAFKPDIIISQQGCDAHRLDPLTHLSADVECLIKATETIKSLSEELCEGKWVALGGGGYAIWQVVPRVWALVWAVMIDKMPSGELPEDWVDHWSQLSPDILPTRWYDTIDNEPIRDWADFDGNDRRDQNMRVADEVLRVAMSHLV